MLMFDRYFIRGIPLSFNFFDARASLENTQASLISTVAAGLSAFSLFGPALIKVSEALGTQHHPSMKWIAHMNAWIYIAASVLLGSRSLVTVYVIVSMLAMTYAGKLNGPQKKRSNRLLVYLAVAVMLVFFSAGLMLSRLEQMGLDPMHSLALSSYSATVKIAPWLTNLADSQPTIEPFIAAVLSLVLYVYHGIFEFFLLFDSYRSPHTMGALIGWLPVKLLGVLTGRDLSVDLDSLDGFRSGVFNTFIGPVFVDFGWFALLAVPILFFGLGYPVRLLRGGRVEWLPMVLLTGTICIMFPMLNLLESATGMYPLVAAIVIGLYAQVRMLRRSTPSDANHV